MNKAYVPYGTYWSTPFAKWQGSLGHLHSMKLAANVARDTLAAKKFPMDAIDLGILGITIPQPSSFFGLPWVTGMIGIPNVPGPTVSQACATSARVLQMAADEVEQGIGHLRARGDHGPLFEWRNARLSQPTGPGGTNSH
jgi:acetyl-CoA acetyltransferase